MDGGCAIDGGLLCCLRGTNLIYGGRMHDQKKEARMMIDGRAIEGGQTRDLAILLHYRTALQTVSLRQNVVMEKLFVTMSALSRITITARKTPEKHLGQ